MPPDPPPKTPPASLGETGRTKLGHTELESQASSVTPTPSIKETVAFLNRVLENNGTFGELRYLSNNHGFCPAGVTTENVRVLEEQGTIEIDFRTTLWYASNSCESQRAPYSHSGTVNVSFGTIDLRDVDVYQATFPFLYKDDKVKKTIIAFKCSDGTACVLSKDYGFLIMRDEMHPRVLRALKHLKSHVGERKDPF
jgi:hypothetical protein